MSLLMRVLPFPSGPSGLDICMVGREYYALCVGSGTSCTAAATLTLKSDGDLTVAYTGGGSGTPNGDEWHCDNIDSTLGALWDVRATLTSGTTPTTNAGLGTWLSLASNRAWGNSVTSTGAIVTSTLTFDFRATGGGGTILKTVTGVIIKAEASTI